MKTKTITIAVQRHLDPQSAGGGMINVYRCKQITDSTEYTPGQEMTKKQVDELCEATYWKVTLVQANP